MAASGGRGRARGPGARRRARWPAALLSRAAEPRRDRAALLRLARWCGRYGPNRNADGADGLWIDVTGVAHLYGGEERLIDDLCARLARFGLTVRAGLADTLGAAHALARFAPSPAIALPGETEARLAALPVEALRLAPETVLLLQRLGLRRIGQLYSLPRRALNAASAPPKTAEAVLARLDQALGVRPEPTPPAPRAARPFRAARRWPIRSSRPQGLEAETARLAEELVCRLDARQLGARRVALVALPRRRHGGASACGLELSLPRARRI